MYKFTYLLVFTLLSCSLTAQTLTSPGGRCSFTFALDATGAPTYRFFFGKKEVVQTSRLAVVLKDLPAFEKGFSIVKVDSLTYDQTWKPVWGEVASIRNRYKELAVTLQQASVNNRKWVIRFRLYDDGLGFRYEFPAQPGFSNFVVTAEKNRIRPRGRSQNLLDTRRLRYQRIRLQHLGAQQRERSGRWRRK